MRKTYITPEMTVFCMEHCTSLLAGSAQGTTVYEKEASGDYEVLSRGSFWDEEE